MRAASFRIAGHLGAAIVIAVALTSSARAAETVVLKLGNVQAPTMVVQDGLRRFTELVRERTHGGVEIQVFPASQLGTEQEILEGVQLGTIDMYEGSAASVGQFLPQLQAFACPFLWRSTDSMLKVVRGPIGEKLTSDLLQKRGIRILDLGWIFGVRHLTTAKTPVKSPDDLKGMKIRVQPDPIYLATVRSFGASPTPMAAQEVYTALQTGVVDGQENPISNIWRNKYNEVQKYLMLTGHITQNQLVVISEAKFKSLSPEQQEIMLQAAHEAGDYQNGLIANAESADLEKLKGAGMQVLEPDIAAFRKAAAGVCHDPAIEAKIGKGFYDEVDVAQN